MTIHINELGELFRSDFCEVQRLVENADQSQELKVIQQQTNDYFLGKRSVFNINYNYSKSSTFQNQVWRALGQIPAGETRSYKKLAEDVGRARAYRAVGNANGKNPIPFFIPCHRVVAANGLGGYSAGLLRKKALLSIEEKLYGKVKKPAQNN